MYWFIPVVFVLSFRFIPVILLVCLVTACFPQRLGLVSAQYEHREPTESLPYGPCTRGCCECFTITVKMFSRLLAFGYCR